MAALCLTMPRVEPRETCPQGRWRASIRASRYASFDTASDDAYSGRTVMNDVTGYNPEDNRDALGCNPSARERRSRRVPPGEKEKESRMKPSVSALMDEK